jgi:hypothetical protein
MQFLTAGYLLEDIFKTENNLKLFVVLTHIFSRRLPNKSSCKLGRQSHLAHKTYLQRPIKPAGKEGTELKNLGRIRGPDSTIL